MAKEVYKKWGVFAGGESFASATNEVAIDIGAESLDCTDFDSDTRKEQGGLKTAGVSAGGFWDGDVVDETVFPAIGSVDGLECSFVAGQNVGDYGYSLTGMVGDYSMGGEVGVITPYQITVATQKPLFRGRLLLNSTITTGGSTTAYQLGAITVGKVAYAVVHITAITGSPSVQVFIDSDDNSSMTSHVARITFDAATAKSGVRKSYATVTTDDWWRARYTITSGSANVAVLVGVNDG